MKYCEPLAVALFQGYDTTEGAMWQMGLFDHAETEKRVYKKIRQIKYDIISKVSESFKANYEG